MRLVWALVAVFLLSNCGVKSDPVPYTSPPDQKAKKE